MPRNRNTRKGKPGRPSLKDPEARIQAERREAAEKARNNLKLTLEHQLNALEGPFSAAYDEVEALVGDWMDEQGFNQNSELEMIALMHSELSEAVEALRKPRAPAVLGDKLAVDNTPLSGYTHDSDPVAEELADCIIRIMHYGSRFGHDISGCIISKCLRNLHREFKHGKTC